MNDMVDWDLREILRVLWKKAWILLLSAVLTAGLLLAYTVDFVTPLYTASVTIYVNNNSRQNNTAVSSSDLAVALRLVNTYINILGSDQVLDEVIKSTGIAMTPDNLRAMISAEAMGETEMFEVSVSTPSPEMSRDLANAIADIAPAKISNVIEGSSAKIVDYAKLPSHRSSPSYTKSTIFGFMIGLLGSATVIVVLFLLDKRIKSERDLMRICKLPVLGRIPDIVESTEQKGKKTRR